MRPSGTASEFLSKTSTTFLRPVARYDIDYTVTTSSVAEEVEGSNVSYEDAIEAGQKLSTTGLSGPSTLALWKRGWNERTRNP